MKASHPSAAAASDNADRHQQDELVEQLLRQQSLELLRRVHGPVDLKRTAYEVVNECRRAVDCDRVSLLLRKGNTWKLLAVSGVDRTEPRADATKRLCELAQRTAQWGEPICYAECTDDNPENQTDDLPPELCELIQQHTDESHARQIVTVPLRFKPLVEGEEPRLQSSYLPDAVLPHAMIVAEQFDVARTMLLRQCVVELAELCEPALRQAVRLDRLPVRVGIRLSRMTSWLGTSLGQRRTTFALAALLAVVGALVYVPIEFEVSASAKLVPLVERNLFAPCDGTVVEIHAAHGDRVQPGDALAVLHDPDLALESQQIHGEIETVIKQLDAVAAARTDRSVREEAGDQGLPLSAKQQQLAGRLISLRRQLKILDQRRDALVLRSPIAGQVLTLDVQNLLQARPVQRGEVLFTVADLQSGWRLEADLPQDRLGHVVQAQQAANAELPVRFRLAGDLSETFVGHVEQISSTVVLDTDDLTGDVPPMRVRICVDEPELVKGRPGMTADVRIACGRRSIGFVWLHDVWETVYRWFVF